MGRVNLITMEEMAAAYHAAVALAKTAIGDEDGFVKPTARIGSLSDWEWMKLCEGAVSGWIVARSRQLTSDRFGDESFFLATGEVPEATELGIVGACLPALGEFVEKMGMTEKPIGSWSKQEITLFAWTCAELVNEARVRVQERPGPVEAPEWLMAG